MARLIKRTHKRPYVLALWMGGGMALVQSEFRKGVYHSTDIEEMVCSCEDNQINKQLCKHLAALLEMDKAGILPQRSKEQK